MQKTLVISLEPQATVQNGDFLLWDGWDVPKGAISLNQLLKKELIEIRTEHMQWAYAVGLAKMDATRDLQDCLMQGDSPSMWWTSLLYERHPKLSPNLYTIYKLRRLERLLVGNGYKEVVILGGDKRLVHSLKSLCAAHGISFKAQAGKIIRQKTHPYWLLPAPVRALLRYLHWLWKIRRKLPELKSLPKGSTDPKTASIITYFPNIDLQAAARGRFRSRYWESLHDILDEEARSLGEKHFVHWLFIHFPTPEFDLDQCIQLASTFQKSGRDGLSFSFLEQFLSTADLLGALTRWLRLVASSLKIERKFAALCHFKGSRLNFWPYMRSQWAESMRGWRCLERCLHNRAFNGFSRAAGAQRWNLFALENCPWERMATEALRNIKGNGTIIGAQHSTLRPTDFRYFDAEETFTQPVCSAFQPDIIAGNGDSACNQWLANGMPHERIRKVEALRYLYLNRHPVSKKPGKELPPEPGSPLEPGEGKKLLILTGFFQDENRYQLQLLKEAMENGILANWRIVLKPHPYCSIAWWLDSLDSKLQNKIFLSHAPLAEELVQGTTVWACNSTSASLEAAVIGLPVLVMAPIGDFDLCPIQNIPELSRIGNMSDLTNALAHPEPLSLPEGYLDLDPDLPAWRELLGIAPPQKRNNQ